MLALKPGAVLVVVRLRAPLNVKVSPPVLPVMLIAPIVAAPDETVTGELLSNVMLPPVRLVAVRAHPFVWVIGELVKFQVCVPVSDRR